jgi:Fic family protein
MFRKEYGAFRYISISNLLKDAATQYGKSYLYTETDEMDMTYFIDYQCSIIMRAVSTFKNHCQKAIADIESFNQWLWKTGTLKKLNDKQKVVFQVARSKVQREFTATNVKENLGCSYNTASAVLNGLVDLNLFGKKKEGREWVFYLLDQNDIQHHWKP